MVIAWGASTRARLRGEEEKDDRDCAAAEISTDPRTRKLSFVINRKGHFRVGAKNDRALTAEVELYILHGWRFGLLDKCATCHRSLLH